MSSGWIKLHRQLLEWEWYNDINATRLFLHLMLKANHKDKKYRGTVIKRGQLLTGRELLSAETGLSQQQIRTCLNKLKSTSDITIKSTNKGTLLTVENYGVYQDAESELTSKSTSELTSKQPMNNQQATTNKNVRTKECKNKDICQQVADAWNNSFSDLPNVLKVSDKRKAHIKAAIKFFSGKHDLNDPEQWSSIFEYASNSDFLMGRASDWSMDFDFIINKNNLLKVLEGKYE
jgi:hypothetical protein